MAVPFVSAIVDPPTMTSLPPIPIDFFNLCAVKINLQLMVIPNAIGSVFGMQFPSLQLPTQTPKIAERETPRIIRIHCHRFAHVPHQELARTLGVDSHDNHRGHNIFLCYGRLASVCAFVLDFYGGMGPLPPDSRVSRSLTVVTSGHYSTAFISVSILKA